MRKQADSGAKRGRRRKVSPAYARWVIGELKRHASRGNAWAAASVENWLALYPELRSELPELRELAAKAEAAWVQAAGGGDPLAEQAAAREAAALKAELLGPSPSTLDRLLVSAVVVAHLAFNTAAALAARPAEHPTVSDARDRRLMSAQKRLAEAVKAWQAIRGRTARGLRPAGQLKVFAPVAG